MTETHVARMDPQFATAQVRPSAIVTPRGFYVWWQGGPAAWIDLAGALSGTRGIGWRNATYASGLALAYEAFRPRGRLGYVSADGWVFRARPGPPRGVLGGIVDGAAGSLLAWTWSAGTLDLWRTESWVAGWTRLATERRWPRYDPSLPVMNAYMGRVTDRVTVLHPESDGTLTFARDGAGFARLIHGRVIDAGDAGGYAGVTLVSAVDGLYATGWVFADDRPVADVRRVGDPAWSPDLPRWFAAANPWWDVDAKGHLRGTVRRGATLVSMAFEDRPALTRVAIPPLPPGHAPGLVAQTSDRLLVDGAEFYAAVDAKMLKGGVLRTELAPRPVPGTNRLVYDPWSRRSYELSADATSWRPFGGPARHDVAVDGCGRRWTLRSPSYAGDGTPMDGRSGWSVTVTDTSGPHDLGPLPALSGWTQVIARPEGIAIGGSSLVHDVHQACPGHEPAPGEGSRPDPLPAG